jgi:hypothetical protein
MAKHGEGEVWFGKTCVKCEAPINYAQAAKGVIPGLCGKCTDEVRRQILAERRSSGQVPVWREEPPPRSFATGFLAGFLLALALVVAAGVVLWLRSPESGTALLKSLR